MALINLGFPPKMEQGLLLTKNGFKLGPLRFSAALAANPVPSMLAWTYEVVSHSILIELIHVTCLPILHMTSGVDFDDRIA